jgi:hypothetical protein
MIMHIWDLISMHLTFLQTYSQGRHGVQRDSYSNIYTDQVSSKP